jgi:hypothetical protein
MTGDCVVEVPLDFVGAGLGTGAAERSGKLDTVVNSRSTSSTSKILLREVLHEIEYEPVHEVVTRSTVLDE